MSSSRVELPPPLSRRRFVESLCGGFGAIGLAGMLAPQLGGAPRIGGGPAGPHFAPKAKRVIFLFLTGGPSHLDMFDPKPALLKHAGERPESADLRTERMTGGLLPSPFAFQRHGQAGTYVSELLPKLSGMVDDMAVIRSMYTFNPTHTPARNLIHSGNIASTRPTLGAWVSYGLGTENQNLPGFVALSPSSRGGSLWRSGFLPAEHQGTHFDNSQTDPEQMIQYLRNAKLDAAAQRDQLDLLQALNREHRAETGEDAYLDGRIQAMETAYRMQFEALDVFDVRQEPEKIARNTVRPRSPPVACSPAGWWSAACATCTSTTAPASPGTTTRRSTASCASAARTWTRPPRRCCWI
jgi:hypothetical protein